MALVSFVSIPAQGLAYVFTWPGRIRCKAEISERQRVASSALPNQIQQMILEIDTVLNHQDEVLLRRSVAES